MHLNSLIDASESEGSHGRLLLFQAIQSIIQKAWKRKRDFSLCAFLFPGPVSHGKATLWLSGQAQDRDTVCTQDRVSALVLVRWRGSMLIMAVLYLLKAQKGLSVEVGDGASVDCP